MSVAAPWPRSNHSVWSPHFRTILRRPALLRNLPVGIVVMSRWQLANIYPNREYHLSCLVLLAFLTNPGVYPSHSFHQSPGI